MSDNDRDPQEPVGDHAGRVGLVLPLVTAVAAASAPFLAFLATNQGQLLRLGELALVWAVTTTIFVGVVLLAARRSRATSRRVAAFAAPLVLLFFSFPLTRRVAAAGGYWHPRDEVVAWVLLAGAAGAFMVIASRWRAVQVYMALLACGLAAVPAWQLATTRQTAAEPVVAATSEDGASTTEVADPGLGGQSADPNIWLFLTDGFGSPDVIREAQGVDVAPLVDDLRAHGFTIPPQARSNYPATFASVSSLLEMEYLVDETNTRTGIDRARLNAVIQGDNQTVNRLKDRGYSYVQSTPVLWDSNRCAGYEDICVSGPAGRSQTLRALTRMTPLDHVLSNQDRQQMADQSDPSWVTDTILDRSPTGPYFAFVHVMSPHAPFLHDRDCQLRGDTEIALDGDPSGENLPGAIECLGTQLRRSVDTILASDPDAIIVIQGDHSYGAGGERPWGWGWASGRFEVFSALRLPSGCSSYVPEDLAATNVMRVVLACVEGATPDLLPFESYMVQEGSSFVESIQLPDT